MALPQVVAVAPSSPADRAGLLVGDEIVAMNGETPRDVIQYQLMADSAELELDIRRGGLDRAITVTRSGGEPLGIEVQSALFDQVRTCDNHCEFCFIYQLPKGLRPSLYQKDDDYRLSFLYGNFTTLTRFTEADLERVITENLSPLHVSIHSTDPVVRARMLRNRRGATSLRWLRALLDADIEVHGQIVVCPGVNDAAVLDDTLAGVLDEYPELTTVAAVPLGISRYSNESDMRPHTFEEASRVIDILEAWQEVFLQGVGRRVAYAADEYYLLAGRPFPPASTYEGFAQHENGVGMVKAFEAELLGEDLGIRTNPGGFFSWVDGAPPEGYRAPRVAGCGPASVSFRRPGASIGILTGTYGAKALQPLLPTLQSAAGGAVDLLPVDNQFFGGNIGVTGLMVGEDIARAMEHYGSGYRYLLPDVCLSNGKFLDGLTVADLPEAVEIVATDGASLRNALVRRAA